MSFPRAAIKRFNETADTSIPPPGTYDPKFITDVAVKASSKTLDMHARTSGSQSRHEDNELGSSGRASRDRSLSRRSLGSSDELSKSRKRDQSGTNTPKTSTSKTRLVHLSRPRSVQSSSGTKIPKIKSANSGPVLSSKLQIHSSVKDDKASIENSNTKKNPSAKKGETSSHEFTGIMCNSFNSIQCQDVIQEIQDMAQKLQVELLEYKRRLTEAEIRGNELTAKKHEDEFTIRSLKRELLKYESFIQSTEIGENMSCGAKLQEFSLDKLKLEKEVYDLQLEKKQLELSHTEISERISKLEEEKSAWQKEKMKYELALDQLQKAFNLQGKENNEEKCEEKCKGILSKFGFSLNLQESSESDLTEVSAEKVLELTRQNQELQKELDALKQKTLPMEQASFLEFMNSGRSGKYQNYLI